MITTELTRESAKAALDYELKYNSLLRNALPNYEGEKKEVFIFTMCSLAFKCEAFVFDNNGKIPFTTANNNTIALIYDEGRKGKFKRTMREISGQLMEITDNRAKYFERLDAYLGRIYDSKATTSKLTCSI